MEQTSNQRQDVPAVVERESLPLKSASRGSRRCLFTSLPDDVLFAIFRKCDRQTLGRLCRVCHRLNDLIQSDSIWLDHSKEFLIFNTSAFIDIKNGNVSHSEIARTQQRPILKEQMRLSDNWVEKKYHEKVLLRFHPRQLPWLQYTEDAIWISTNNEIKCFKPQKGGGLKESRGRRLVLEDGQGLRGRRRQMIVNSEPSPNLLNQDVSRFVVKDSLAVSGCRDGSLYVFDCTRGKCLDAMYKIHRTDTQAVDFHNTCIVSGSRDKSVKIITMTDEDCNNNPVKASIELEDRVWSVAMATTGECFTAGTSGCRGNPSLSVWDIERVQVVCTLGSYRYGAGVLDMKYEDNNTLLTCGYDANLRMWDLRCGQCVKEWHEPYDTTLYCLQSDRNAVIITGSARYGMLRLWDKRKQDPVQEYFLSQKSPVYSVAFDSARLYAALDLSIHIMDFTMFPT